MDDNQPPSRKKILIIRFSSIGDIVLTTPVVRAIKNQITDAEIHFLVKKGYESILRENPYISKLHIFKGNLRHTIKELKNENFNFIVDLQNNRRSNRIDHKLKTPFHKINKLNFLKWIAVNFKINFLPIKHIVDRYFDVVSPLNVKNDGDGLDYFVPEEEEFDAQDLPAVFEAGFIAVSMGSIHKTKQIPSYKLIEIGRILHKPMMLLGGKDVINKAEKVVSELGERAFNGCGKYSLNQSASILRKSDCVLTGDTGLMHIAAAFRKPIASIWGNTIPEFGMYPYMPQNRDLFRIFEVCHLKCRPCSKLGFKKCPRKHFKCMKNISAVEVADWINKF